MLSRNEQDRVARLRADLDKPKDTQSEIERLARLSPIEYDKERETVAKELSIRVSTLDAEVEKYRTGEAEDDSLDVVEELTPWPSPVNGRDIYNHIHCAIEDYVVISDGLAVPLALWVMGTYAINSFGIFPKVLVKSAEKQCGKTTLIETLEGLVNKAYISNNITASALFRVIDKYQPTILIDEADQFLRDDPELNGIINAGHKKRTATVTRNVKINDDFEPRKFNVWCPQIIAGIGNQRDTLVSRSIEVYLRRRLPTEYVKKLPVDFFERNKSLRQMCLRWAIDNEAKLTQLMEAPPCGNDRKQDNYSPLWTIASLIDEEAVKSLKAVYEMEADDESESAGMMLLQDIKQILEDYPEKKIFSGILVDKLIDLDDRPWAEWKHGKPMTKTSLARLLKPFRIKSQYVRIGGTVSRGYEHSDFDDAFSRYLSPIPPNQSVTTLQVNDDAGLRGNQSVTPDNDVTLSKSLNPNNDAGCNTVTLSEGGNGETWGDSL